MTHTVLLVDDDPLVRNSLGEVLSGANFSVTIAASGEEAVALLGEHSYDLILTDLVMQGLDGFQVLKKAKKDNPLTKVIILTAFGSTQSAIDALRLDADDFLHKPCSTDDLFFRIDRCLKRLDLEKKIKVYEKILPVCCVCKKIRDDQGKEPGTGGWYTIEDYIRKKAYVDVTSTYCPRCASRARQEIDTHFQAE